MDIEDIAIQDEEIHPKPTKIKLTFKQNIQPQVQHPAQSQPKLVKFEVISASRRTDIPAFFMDRIIQSLKDGVIEVISPAPWCVKSIVSLSPKDVKCFVWWSKDYAIWLQMYQDNKPLFDQYKHIFNFTLIGDPILESGVKSTFEERLIQMKTLAQLFGPLTIKLRFDPITYWYDQKGTIYNNLGNYETVVHTASELGIRKVIFAFCVPYPKVARRMQKYGKILHILSFDEKKPPPPEEQKKIHAEQKRILDPLLDLADRYSIQLETCCGSQLIGYRHIGASRCVDGDIINQLCGNLLKIGRKDSGQRSNCNCVTSRDIGSYNMICGHKCLYCYANPAN